jgi:two-component system, OmpR family, KDP operon response regulator KdpE
MLESTPNVLIVDDDPGFRQGLRVSLKASGYKVETARNGEDALQYIRERAVDIILLDINMPGIGGVETCRRIRVAAPNAGILMLTVRDSEDDKVGALEAGADDYVTKPFRIRELNARLRALLRRTGVDAAARVPVLRIGELELELEHRSLRKAGELIHLSPKEFEILALLMQNPNVPITHARILRTIWGPEYGDEPEYLRSYVKTLRKKIEAGPSHPEYILTEPWIGYRLCNPSDRDKSLMSETAQQE